MATSYSGQIDRLNSALEKLARDDFAGTDSIHRVVQRAIVRVGDTERDHAQFSA